MNTIQSLWSTVLSVSPDAVLLTVLALLILMLAVFTAVVIQFGTRLHYLATPLFDRTVKEAQERAEHILVDAREQGSAIRMQAQMEAEKIFTNRKEEDEKFRTEQAAHLEEITLHAKDLLTKHVQVAEKMLRDEAESMRQTFAKENESMKQTFADVGAQVQHEYKEFTAEIKKRMSDEMAKEIDLARQAVTIYKQERFGMLDKEIVGLVEDTARIALHKSLSLDEHRGIILDALAEAKRQGVFSTLS